VHQKELLVEDVEGVVGPEGVGERDQDHHHLDWP
jgi:hypothetical protein